MSAISETLLASCPIEAIQINITQLNTLVNPTTASEIVKKLKESQFAAFKTKTGEVFLIDPHKCQWKKNKILSLFLEKVSSHSIHQAEEEESDSSTSSSDSSSFSLDSAELDKVNLNVGPCQLL